MSSCVLFAKNSSPFAALAGEIKNTALPPVQNPHVLSDIKPIEESIGKLPRELKRTGPPKSVTGFDGKKTEMHRTTKRQFSREITFGTQGKCSYCSVDTDVLWKVSREDVEHISLRKKERELSEKKVKD